MIPLLQGENIVYVQLLPWQTGRLTTAENLPITSTNHRFVKFSVILHNAAHTSFTLPLLVVSPPCANELPAESAEAGVQHENRATLTGPLLIKKIK